MRRAALVLPILLFTGLAAAIWSFRARSPDRLPGHSQVADENNLLPRVSGLNSKSEDPSAVRHSVAGEVRVGDTIAYRIVDRETSEPVAGARVLAVWARRDLGVADSEGRVWVDAVDGAAVDPTRAAFVAEGYLVAVFAMGGSELTRMNQELAAGEIVEVRLVPDQWSSRVNLRFLLPGGALAESVSYRLELAESAPAVSSAAGLSRDLALEMAWRTHVFACSLKRLGALPAVCGLAGSAAVGVCDGEQTVWIGTAGRYLCTATAGREWIGSAEIVVQPGRGNQDVQIDFAPGLKLTGQVLGARGRPLADAHVETSGRAMGNLRVLSGADGRFELRPLSPGMLTLRVDHPEYEPVELPSITLPARPLRIELKSAGIVEWRGYVRVRGSGVPVAGAELHVGPKTAISDARGQFYLRVSRRVTQIEIGASGYFDYRERVAADRLPAAIDRIPADRSERLRAGLTAVVFGLVTDELGDSVADVPVELRAVSLGVLSPVQGRRIELGGDVPLTLKATTDSLGRYELETAGTGPSTVQCRSGIVDPAHKGRSVTLIRGQRHQVDLRFYR